jgi:FK506-binding protein 2
MAHVINGVTSMIIPFHSWNLQNDSRLVIIRAFTFHFSSLEIYRFTMIGIRRLPGLFLFFISLLATEVKSFHTQSSIHKPSRIIQEKRLCLKESSRCDDSTNKNNNGPSRREAIAFLVGSNLFGGLVSTASTANAAVTDETDTFADNWWSGDTAKSSPLVDEPKLTQRPRQQSQALPSDEIVISIPKEDLKQKQGLGLELGEVEFRTNTRIFVKSVSPGSTADRLGIQKDWIVVGVNGQSAERTDASGVAIMVYRAARSEGGDEAVEFRFRDPAIFQTKLNRLSAEGGAEVTTQVAPAGDTTQRNPDGSVKLGRSVTEQYDQRLTISQLVPPRLCSRGSTTDDLMEISYVGRVLDTGAIFDGSAVMINGEGIAGRGNDVSIFFVLGKQPFGQFPPGWDVGLTGMCVGERRRMIVPPALAFGATGVPRRGIPPNAALQYDVTLISLNGLATPQ